MTRNSLKGLLLALTLAAGAAPALAQGTAFTYQGELQSSGSPISTPADFQFSLFTAATGGTQVGSPVTRSGVSVSSGLFTTPVDFGVNPYTSNQALFLEIAVRNPAGSGSFVTLGSRQALTPAPFSLATRGINVNAAGDIGLLTGTNRTISVPNTPLNANGTNLTILAGNANTAGTAADGGDLVLEAGSAVNADQSFVRPGDVFIRSGGNATTASNAPNGGDIIMQTGRALSAITERMRVTHTGNVGIGTTTPPEVLSVGDFGAVSDRYIQISTAGGNAHRAGLKLRHSANNAGYTIESDERGAQIGGAFGLNFIDLNANPGNTPRSVMLIQKLTGNVGIGTTTPAAPLDVMGNLRVLSNGTIRNQAVASTFGNHNGLIETHYADNDRFGMAQLPAGKLALYSGDVFGGSAVQIGTMTGASTFSPSMTVARGGNVGIGTTTPDQRLSVNGNASKTGGGSWAVLSDERTKTNIQPMTGTLDRLLQLKGHAYTYKPEFVQDGRALPGTQIGLVAQEVEAVFPDWVSTDADGMKQVTERSTTALMVEALRDLRTEKDAEIDALKARLEKLEALLAAQASQQK
jgi:hypothetical protein